MIPHRAYVDFPTQIVSTFRGIRKYSTDRASANEFGGIMHTSPLNSTNDFGSNCFGSTIVEFTFVKIRNSSATRISYAVFCLKKQITPSRTCRSVKDSIILCSSALRRIQRSGLTAIQSSPNCTFDCLFYPVQHEKDSNR